MNELKVKTFGIPPSEILPGLFIGNIYDAGNPQFILENKIATVLNVSNFIPKGFCPLVKYVWAPLAIPFDVNDAKRVSNFIENEYFILGNRMLFHCHSGVDRSPAILYWLLNKRGEKNAYGLIEEKRPQIVHHEDWWSKVA